MVLSLNQRLRKERQRKEAEERRRREAEEDDLSTTGRAVATQQQPESRKRPHPDQAAVKEAPKYHKVVRYPWEPEVAPSNDLAANKKMTAVPPKEQLAAAAAPPAPAPPGPSWYETIAMKRATLPPPNPYPTQVLAARYLPSPSSSLSCSQQSPAAKIQGMSLLKKAPAAAEPKKFTWDDGSSEESFDLTGLAAKLEAKRKKTQDPKSNNVPQTTVAPDTPTAPPKAAKAPAAAKRSDTPVAETPSPLQQAARKKPSTPRNPLAVAKESNRRARLSLSSSPHQPTAAAAADAGLWSDDDNEVVEKSQSPDAKAKAKAKDQSKKKAQAKSQQPAKKATRRATRNTKLLQDDDDADDDVATAAEHKPYFLEPKRGFGPFAFEPLPLEELGFADDPDSFQVPASINRYLKPYQQEGVRFMFKAVKEQGGSILGDDMGLGKTVQTIALLAALFGKTGTGLDLVEIQQRRKAARERKARMDVEQERAFQDGRFWQKPTEDENLATDRSPWLPVLIIVPPSIVQNWVKDFATWGHFSICLYNGSNREKALEDIELGIAEVMVCKQSLFTQDSDVAALSTIQWKMIVVDEFHQYKNKKTIMATGLRQLRDEHSSPVVGLTGTLMQNDHDELWNLVDLVVKDYLGPWEEFKSEFGMPIKLSRVRDANAEALEIGGLCTYELTEKLRPLRIRRTKEDKLKADLPTKDERIVFCDPSELQKQLYQHLLSQPDFVLLSRAKSPCECGVNQKFFLEYQHLATEEERIEYRRQNKKNIVNRKNCCHTAPIIPGEGIDPRAVLWRQSKDHVDGEACRMCPYCILFSALHFLYKLTSHVSLLQLPAAPESSREGSTAHKTAVRDLERAKVFLPEAILPQLPGGSYIRDVSMMDDHFSLSGKMKVLDKLLKTMSDQQGRVLLFSASTQSLDLIQNYLQSVGYSFLRMDGTTSATKRVERVKEFAKPDGVFVFLLSTKAMGLGLNLTQANYVIIYDVEWNPAWDAQAQDRAYRIGQTRNVKVFRLVTKGTIEELKYLRQVYKTQLTTETIVDTDNGDREKSARIFRGVAGDTDRQGELFGLANLLKFKDGTFMNYATDNADSSRYGVGVHQKEQVVQAVEDLNEDAFAEIGEDENVFLDLARRTTEFGEHDDGDSMHGGETQNDAEIFDRAEARLSSEASPVYERPTVGPGSPVGACGIAPKSEDSNLPADLGKTFATKPTTSIKLQDRALHSNGPTDLAGLEKAVKKDPSTTQPPRSQPSIHAGPDASKALVKRDPSTAQPPRSQPFTPASKVLAPMVKRDPDAAVEQGPTSVAQQAELVPDKPKSKEASSLRNHTLVGQTTNKIKSGDAGATSFSAFDLPSGTRKKKKRKKI